LRTQIGENGEQIKKMRKKSKQNDNDNYLSYKILLYLIGVIDGVRGGKIGKNCEKDQK
jgi:hypothetical protein